MCRNLLDTNAVADAGFSPAGDSARVPAAVRADDHGTGRPVGGEDGRREAGR